MSSNISLWQNDAHSCQLLDGFAILIQVLLAFTALGALLFKRWRERPRRSLRIWSLDVSKQFFGAGLCHFLNLGFSYVAGRPADGSPSSNLCVWYFLNLAADTTIGVAVLWCWLFLLKATLGTWFPTVRSSGCYGPSPLRHQLSRWASQTAMFLLAETLMKVCLYGMFRSLPILFYVGDWVLSLIGRANYRYQVVFVMFVFPLVMNAFQFCVIDTIIKVNNAPSRRPSTLWQQKKSACDYPTIIVHDETTPLL
ncbi:Vaculolar membrane protein-domain-containing protein [Syncephalastrum racemosum]|uniref:Vaculolar membrane protein-domain-containing protein n=1 Tax=Syncephalastrum racemosum TaxID=13706 RepID=A0A1X2H6F1_SYNRA|nr:Vaculolar membrane protein-domain-containing protein [Syncephalastrum racemosum]